MGSQHSDNSQGYIEDTRFGLIKIEGSSRQTQQQELDSEESDEVIVLRGFSLPYHDYQKWRKKVKAFRDLREILFLPACTKVTSKGLCGSNCTLQLKYPVYRILLRQEVNNRYLINKSYEETQIWYLLFNLVALGKHFEKYGQKMGDLHPKNIIINEKGWIKVIGEVSLPKQQNNFIKICQSQINDVFLAPQQIDYDCFQRYKYPPGANPNTAELFSMGMTILQVGTLQLSTYIYDKGPYRLNFNKLRNNLQIFQSKYSRKLYQIVASLLASKPSNRKTCKNIYNTLKPYEHYILNMQPFTWENQSHMKEQSLKYSSAGHSQANSSIMVQGLIDNRRMSSVFTDHNELPVETKHHMLSSTLKTQPKDTMKKFDRLFPSELQ